RVTRNSCEVGSSLGNCQAGMRTALREVLVTVTSRVPLPRACMPTRSGLVGRVAGAAMAAAIAPARTAVPATNGTSEPFMQNLLFVDDGSACPAGGRATLRRGAGAAHRATHHPGMPARMKKGLLAQALFSIRLRMGIS